jgi:hypothetical protein
LKISQPFLAFCKAVKSPLPPPFVKGGNEEFSKGNKTGSFIKTISKALLPLEKGGREGFPGMPFQKANDPKFQKKRCVSQNLHFSFCNLQFSMKVSGYFQPSDLKLGS